MKILVINLPSSKDRLSFQTKQLNNLELTFEIIHAVSKDDLTQEELVNLTNGWERPLRSSELACFLSHKKAWQFVETSKLPALILEDDALLSKHTKNILNALEKKELCDLVTLEVRNRKKVVSKIAEELTLKYKLSSLYQDRTGAAAYILWPSGARKLLDKSTKSKPGLADAFISSSYNLSAFQVEPAAAIQLDQCDSYKIDCNHLTKSTISNQLKTDLSNVNLTSRMVFKYRRIYSQLRMGLRQLICFWVSRRRHINLEPADFNYQHIDNIDGNL